jgi:hypothetical protein
MIAHRDIQDTNILYSSGPITTSTSSLVSQDFGEEPGFSGQPLTAVFSGSLGGAALEFLQAVFIFRGDLERTPSWSSPTARSRDLRVSDATAFSNAEAVPRIRNSKLVQHLVRYLRFYFRPPYGAALATRVETLVATLHEEGEGLELSGWSLAHLIGFLENNPSIGRPKLAAGPSGEIAAFWRHENDEFSARFLPNGAVKFLLAVRSPYHPSGVSRSSGDTTLTELYARAGLADLKWLVSG